MGKGALLALGAASAGGLGIGGLVAFKPWKSTSKEDNSIKVKYSIAILDSTKDSEIWEKKYGALSTYSPYNSNLIKAKDKKSGTGTNKEEAKRLLRIGCGEVYSVSTEDLNNLKDFKVLCAKTNENATKNAGNWITDEASKSSENKWDTILTRLKGHDSINSWSLDNALEILKSEIQGVSSTFSTEIRGKLKSWCDAVKLEVFKGEASSEFRSQEAFCKNS